MPLSEYVHGLDLRNADQPEQSVEYASEHWRNLQWVRLDGGRLRELPADLHRLRGLKSLSASGNSITELHAEDLQTAKNEIERLTLYNNKLRTLSMPEGMHRLRSLNVSRNELTSLDDLPHMPQLKYLDVGYNQLQRLPLDWASRCPSLEVLLLAGNRSLRELPTGLKRLPLKRLKLAETNLYQPSIDALMDCRHLEELDLSDIGGDEDAQVCGVWIPLSLCQLTSLTYLKLAGLKLNDLPVGICHLPALKRLDLSRNKLCELKAFKFADAPDYPRKLEVLDLSQNELYRADKLRPLRKLNQLRVLHLDDNELLCGVPKCFLRLSCLERLTLRNTGVYHVPSEMRRGWPKMTELALDQSSFKSRDIDVEFYGINLLAASRRRSAETLENEKHPSASASHPPPISPSSHANFSPHFLQQIERVVSSKTNQHQHQPRQYWPEHNPSEALRYKYEQEQRARLDYSRLFREDAGQSPGLWRWRIDALNPVQMDVLAAFSNTECYIILYTDEDVNHHIYYWLGTRSPLDKQACAAMHAVHLRNHLRTSCRVERQVDSDESMEFRALFADHWKLLEDEHVESALKAPTVDEDAVDTRLFRMDGGRLVTCAPCSISLSMDDVFLALTPNHEVSLYLPREFPLVAKNQAWITARQLGRRVQQVEYAEIMRSVGHGGFSPAPDAIAPVLYEVVVKKGIELPQVPCLKRGVWASFSLDPKKCFILDAHTELFVWLGRKCPPLTRQAAKLVVDDIFGMHERVEWVYRMIVEQNHEPSWFRQYFVGTSAPETSEPKPSVQFSVDIEDLFQPPTVDRVASKGDAEPLLQVLSETIFYVGKRGLTPIDDGERGYFYSNEAYVILCVCLKNNKPHCTCYYWEGSAASDTLWARFKLEYEAMVRQLVSEIHQCSMLAVRVAQDQEPSQLLEVLKWRVTMRERHWSYPLLFRVADGRHAVMVDFAGGPHDALPADVWYYFDREHTVIWRGTQAEPTHRDLQTTLLATFALEDEVVVEQRHHGDALPPTLSQHLRVSVRASRPRCFQFLVDGSEFQCREVTAGYRISQSYLHASQAVLVIDAQRRVDWAWFGRECPETVRQFTVRCLGIYRHHHQHRDSDYDTRMVEQFAETHEFIELFDAWDSRATEAHYTQTANDRQSLRRRLFGMKQ